MAINQNHISEEINGVKCAVVEKNVSESRVAFLKTLLEANGFAVHFTESPPPKGVTPEAAAELPKSYTVGVADVRFNPINAIFGRLLKTPTGKVVTLAYWQQAEPEPDDSKPYFQ